MTTFHALVDRARDPSVVTQLVTPPPADVDPSLPEPDGDDQMMTALIKNLT